MQWVKFDITTCDKCQFTVDSRNKISTIGNLNRFDIDRLHSAKLEFIIDAAKMKLFDK